MEKDAPETERGRKKKKGKGKEKPKNTRANVHGGSKRIVLHWDFRMKRCEYVRYTFAPLTLSAVDRRGKP